MAGSPPQALSLQIAEGDNSVSLDLVALSPVAQRVEYTVELVGTSRSRHSGATSVPAGERRVLSRMKTGVSGPWCATVHVQEQAGQEYTLQAGECSD